MKIIYQPSYVLLILLSCFLIPEMVMGQDKQKADGSAAKSRQRFSVADGYLTFEAPAEWKKVKPKMDFIHADFTLPRAEGDEQDGRLTISQVGGGIEGNLKRWVGQFRDVDESDSAAVVRKTRKIDGLNVQTIRIKGVYLDSGGRPFGPKTEKEDFELFGAGIEAEGGDVYIKAYGPQKTIQKNQQALETLLSSMKVSDG